MKRARTSKEAIHAEDNAEQQVNGYLNPMLLPPVLNHLFETITFDCEEFKNLRLVSKEWAKASLPIWRKEAWLKLDDGAGASSSLQQFLNMIRLINDPFQLTGKKSGFRKYKISFDRNFCFRPRGSLEFWRKIGPLMTHLNIRDSRTSSGEDFANILFEMTPNLTSLEIISIRPRSLDEMPYPFVNEDMETENFFIGNWDERMRPSVRTSVQKVLSELTINLHSLITFPISWTYLFARLPNIKVLKIEDMPCFTWEWAHDGNETVTISDFFVLLHSMRAVREQMESHYFSQLKILELYKEQNSTLELFSSPILPILRDLNFPLTSLSIHIDVNTNVEEFRRMLELYSLSLQVLKVHRDYDGAPFPQDFPYGVNIPNLKTLSFDGPICKNLHFLTNTPNLVTLGIGTYCGHSALSECYRSCNLNLDIIANTEFRNEALKNSVLPKMEELFIEHEICGRARVKSLAKMMPNVKKLAVGLRTDGFTMVCRLWRKLKYLHIHPCEVSEMGILGMKGKKMYNKPNLTSLKDLTKLVLCPPFPPSTKGRFTNDLIRHGLLVCQSLKRVQVTDKPQLSKEEEEMLDSKRIELVFQP